MDQKAISKARARLETASQQLDQARHAQNYEAFEGAWYLFLSAYKTVYNVLEQGAKSSAESRQWFGGKKKERRNDDLLQYLFQARNDGEHGLGDVTELSPGHLRVGTLKPGYSQAIQLSLRVDASGHISHLDTQSLDGKPVRVEQRGPHAILTPVTGRGGEKYDLPKKHLGEELESQDPADVGALGLRYLISLVEEAQRMVS